MTGKDGTAESKEYDIGIYQGQEHIRPLCYYLAETKAPEGYLLDSTPIEIIFEWKNGKKLVIEKDLTVTNKATEKKLPQTGEFPTGKLMTAAGILCIGTAAVLGICSKKKDRKKGKHEE